MTAIVFSVAGIIKQLKSSDKKKASGPDGIPVRFYTDHATSIAPFLSIIYQRWLDQRKVPQDWKKAQVIPIYKKGRKINAQNYRPISLTSICCRIMELILCSEIMTFLDSEKLICRNQHGFRKQRSCETQLAVFVHEIQQALDTGSQVDAIFLDFQKTFDSVPHCRLMHKVHAYSVSDDLRDWIANFLTDRKHCVVLNWEISLETSVKSGVPQGNMIGPLIFMIYIKDLVDGINSSIRLFMDDGVLYKKVVSHESCAELNDDLQKINVWCSDWQLSLNVNKCNLMCITEWKSSLMYEYKINGQTLEEVTLVKYLGVTIRKDLRWNDQITQVEQPPPEGCQRSHSYCGLRNRLYPDKRPMGFPFDRMPRDGVNTLYEFLTPNMGVIDVKIRFHNKIVPPIFYVH